MGHFPHLYSTITMGPLIFFYYIIYVHFEKKMYFTIISFMKIMLSHTKHVKSDNYNPLIQILPICINVNISYQ